MEFGPDGALYVADWIKTYGTKGAVRIWRIDAPAAAGALERLETQTLLGEGFVHRSTQQLGDLLRHPDMRVLLGSVPPAASL